MENKRPEWTSYISFILATVGSAVGLGNIWRFPYVMGEYGGAIFLLVYLFIIAFICVIPLALELAMGKIYKGDVVSVYDKINPKFKVFGLLGVITSILICCFYFVVGGWIINYIWIFLINDVPADFSAYFLTMNSDPQIPIILTILFLLLTVIFPFLGVNKGIEKANNIMMPLFGLMLLILAGYALTLSGAPEGLKFMLKPDFSKISGPMFLAAFGQALFTLSIGMGAMITYGSYLKQEVNIKKSVYTLIVFDTIVALLAGVVIFPIVFTNGIEPTAGATLVFISLPQIFLSLPFTRILAVLFFVLLFFAAITSGISLLETAVACFSDHYKMSRKKASFLLFFVIALLSIPASLSFGLMADFQIFGKTFFDFLDSLTSNILMPVGTIIVCLVCGWYAKNIAKEALGEGVFSNFLMFILKFILPVIMTAVLFVGLT